MNILKLEQIVTEDKLCKKNIASKVLHDTDTIEISNTIRDTITPYLLDSPHYYGLLANNPLDSIVYALLSNILVVDTTELLTVLIGKIARKLEGEYEETLELSASLLGVLSDTDILDLHLRGQFIVVEPMHKLSEELIDYIHETSYLPPMLVQPNKVTNQHNSGHLSVNKPLILGGKGHTKPLNLHSINTFNSVKYELDMDMLSLIEESSKPLDTKEKRNNFRRDVQAFDKAYDYINVREFYFTNHYCSRGRTYCGGWQLSYQGTDFKKSLINLSTKEIIPL